MRRLIVIFVSILIALLALEFQAQTPPAQTQKPPQTQAPQTPPPAPTPPAAAKPPAPDPLQLAEDWLARLNSLDDWTLTFEGKEVGREDLVNKMMELYAPDVVAEVPPHDDE